MKKLFLNAVFAALLGAGVSHSVHADCTVAWDQLISSEALHRDCIREYGSDIPHFTATWRTADGWNGTEGYMRWLVTRSTGQDDDGYVINHPPTRSRPIYLSFIARVGSSWWTSVPTGTKFVMFYPDTGTNPRPTVFTQPIGAPDGRYAYRTLQPDVEAGGQGCDQFDNCNHDQWTAYPNHTYKEGPEGHSQWYFIVASLESDRTHVYIWDRTGTMSGHYARSQQASSSMLSSWNSQMWRTVRLLAYIDRTVAGDANAYMDIAHVKVSQSLPAPPEGFVTGEANKPSAPRDVVAE